MQATVNPGRFDWVVLFYYPTKAKGGIGQPNVTMNATTRKIRAEKMFKSSSERIAGNQQVGESMLSFRMQDVRGSGILVTQEWEFDAYPISNIALTKRLRVRGIEEEGRKNYIVVTGEMRDNGS